MDEDNSEKRLQNKTYVAAAAAMVGSLYTVRRIEQMAMQNHTGIVLKTDSVRGSKNEMKGETTESF